MTLENLLQIGRLKPHATDRDEVQRLLEAAHRNLADAEVTAVSVETRFDAAYKAIMQAALVALMANGYRPDTKTPGHHATLVQSLTKTIGLPSRRMVLLDALRKKRNLSDYSGAWVDEAATASCIAEAKALLEEVEIWLDGNRPELR
jgi:HEPN domain-containing protein